jgi:hypothetical protein
LIREVNRSIVRLTVSEHRDWLLVDATDPSYGDRVVADLTDIVSTGSGRALLRRLRVSGRVVRVERPDPTDPPNAWVRPENVLAATAAGEPTSTSPAGGAAVGTGAGSDSIVGYDPADWPSPINPASLASDAVLLALLQEACRQTEGSAKPTHYGASTEALCSAAEVELYQRERRGG